MARGLGVVVARADVGVAPQAVGLVAQHQRQLAVRLEAHDAVDDVAAGALELAGPPDVGLLVEACLDLDQHQDLLAGTGRVDQRVDDGGVARGPVERHLDREDLGIGRRLLDEALDARGEGVVRVVHQDVALAQRAEEIGRTGGLDLGEVLVRARHERLEVQLGPVDVGDLVERAQVERSGEAHDLVGAHPELGREQLQHLVGDGGLDLEAHRRTELATQQLLLEGLEQVLRVVLLDLEVLVARLAERVVREDLHAGEQQVQVGRHGVLEREVALRADLHPAVDDGRHLDAREVVLAGAGVAQHHGHVERQAGDVGERVRRVDRERGQHREDPGPVVLRDELLLVGREVVPAQQLDALGLEVVREVLVQVVGVATLELLARRDAALQDLLRVQAARRGHRDARRDAPLQAGDAHHEELVEVAREDRHEAHPLEQREAAVLRELEDPLVERDPGELAIQEAVVGESPALGVVGRVDVELVRRRHVRDVEISTLHGVIVAREDDSRVNGEGCGTLPAWHPSARSSARFAGVWRAASCVFRPPSSARRRDPPSCSTASASTTRCSCCCAWHASRVLRSRTSASRGAGTSCAPARR